MTKLICLFALALAGACNGDSRAKAAASSSPTLRDLSTSLDEVRVEFNAHKAEPRFLTLLSDT